MIIGAGFEAVAEAVAAAKATREDEEESSCSVASCKVTVGVKVIGAMT